MKNKKRFFLNATGVFAISTLLITLLLPLVSCESQGGRVELVEEKGAGFGRPSLLNAILSNEIVFYGQVLDLEGNSVPNAEVKYSSLNSGNFDDVWTKGGSYKYTRTDENGCFEIFDTGGSLYVRCSHPEYYGSSGPEGSKRKFNYGFQSGDEPAWNPQNPAIFRLRQKGVREPLYFSNGNMLNNGARSWVSLSPGEHISIDLAMGKYGKTSTSIYISYETDRKDSERRDYNWKYTLRIPEGGFVEKEDGFNFIAPESGYCEEVKIENGPQWVWYKKKFYFVKFSNGLHGIFEIHAEPGVKGTFSFQALINPNPNSRNLEYEREKIINKSRRGDSYTVL